MYNHKFNNLNFNETHLNRTIGGEMIKFIRRANIAIKSSKKQTSDNNKTNWIIIV